MKCSLGISNFLEEISGLSQSIVLIYFSAYATGEEWRNSSRMNEEAEPKQKQCPVMDVSGGDSKARCLKNNIA